VSTGHKTSSSCASDPRATEGKKIKEEHETMNKNKTNKPCKNLVDEITIHCGDTFNRELYLCEDCKSKEGLKNE